MNRLAFAAENLTFRAQPPKKFISSLKNKMTEKLSTTEGMYFSVKKLLVNRHLINNYYDVFEEDGNTKFVFYYDGFKNNSKNTNEKTIDLFKSQENIRNHLIKNTWTLDTKMDHSQVGAIAIFTIDKNNDVINIVAAERSSKEKYLFKNIEELLIFKFDNNTVSKQSDLDEYKWISKYGIAIKNIDESPFKYINDINYLDQKSLSKARNTLGFTGIEGYDNILVWLPTQNIADPFIIPDPEPSATPSKASESDIVAPVIDPETLHVPMIVPIPGDNGHKPPATQHEHVPIIDTTTTLMPVLEPNMHKEQSVRSPMPTHLITSSK